jgi:hypothetical protein
MIRCYLHALREILPNEMRVYGSVVGRFPIQICVLRPVNLRPSEFYLIFSRKLSRQNLTSQRHYSRVSKKYVMGCNQKWLGLGNNIQVYHCDEDGKAHGTIGKTFLEPTKCEIVR